MLLFGIVYITQVKFYEPPVVITKKKKLLSHIIRRATDMEVQESQSNDDPISTINQLNNGFTYEEINLTSQTFLIIQCTIMVKTV